MLIESDFYNTGWPKENANERYKKAQNAHFVLSTAKSFATVTQIVPNGNIWNRFILAEFIVKYPRRHISIDCRDYFSDFDIQFVYGTDWDDSIITKLSFKQFTNTFKWFLSLKTFYLLWMIILPREKLYCTKVDIGVSFLRPTRSALGEIGNGAAPIDAIFCRMQALLETLHKRP